MISVLQQGCRLNITAGSLTRGARAMVDFAADRDDGVTIDTTDGKAQEQERILHLHAPARCVLSRRMVLNEAGCSQKFVSVLQRPRKF